MPTIFDNITTHLLPTLRTMLELSHRLDVAVGYFHLRGWDALADLVERFAGTDDHCCRLLVGMQRPEHEVMRALQRLPREGEGYLDGPTVARLRRQAAQSFREQLEFGVPSSKARATLHVLAAQLRARKLRVKLFLRHPLHAKLYLVQRDDPMTPLIGFVGSSNLSFSGLSGHGELNVDVVEQDAARKLQHWFDERWDDAFAFDISADLADLIETSWAADRVVAPYHVYLKMAYYLSQDAREGVHAFPLPADLREVLLPFQAEAVALAARYLQRREGVLLGDVVGLGKTLMATAVARIFQASEQSNTLVICPPKLMPMWRDYLARYQVAGAVVSLGKAPEELPHLPRYRLVIVDESHNLRHRQGKRYAAVHDYIERNGARVLLLTATPFNKQFTDLSNQLRLFLDERRDLRIRPERFFQEYCADGRNEADFQANFDASPRSLRAFEQSNHPDDWRDLMRLFMVRRTRQFILRTYATFDAERQRSYVMIGERRAYFPLRQPRTLSFALDEHDPTDQYARLYRAQVVQVIEQLALPRYELAAYVNQTAARRAAPAERALLENLARAGRRLLGFSRTNLFKRLESSGQSFLISLDRQILRNMVTLHALEQGLPVPIGTQDVAMLDPALSDVDAEVATADEGDDEDAASAEQQTLDPALPDSEVALNAYTARAAQVYTAYATRFHRRFQWLAPSFFQARLKRALRDDARMLAEVAQQVGRWQPARDAKLAELTRLLREIHPHEKVLIFTQFADTARYLATQLWAHGVTDLAVATGQAGDPTALARRFSPTSNAGLRDGETELRVLVATDVLGEGQNLQDAHIVVNYDLPWAIIRLIQRVGRVDRIGQQAETIHAYSFLPADGVERIIRLRTRLAERLEANQEVVGTDETFFGEASATQLRDLYTEQAQVLEDDSNEDVDLASAALQVWQSASEQDQRAALALAPIVGATRPVHGPTSAAPPAGVVSYLRFPDGTDAMVRVDTEGRLVSQALAATFRALACGPDTPAVPHLPNHDELVAAALQAALHEQQTFAGQLGSLRSTRRQVYERVKRCLEQHQRRPTLFSEPLLRTLPALIEAVLRFPLREAARTALSQQIRLGASDEEVATNAVRFYEDERLVVVRDADEPVVDDPHIVCALGLVEGYTE
ncbi:NgoFVII family restriction endonuclease [Candidatus Chloroploca sp. M-50]|uniref:NgoFVII family restriction endonuclease n=2 Tax=Candidatus Chloroploca mongolica TaxID=2528176 RepID=A0ABS4DHS5_9CHLR|nr:NgoFVII family restriction endonuclease [Candidatus Chloroploca mongolica]